MSVLAAAAGGLVLATAGLAAADSDGHGAHGGNTGVVCAAKDTGVSNICGNTNTYKPVLLDNLLSLLSPHPYDGGISGGGGNN
ncbi:hypothetical protein [Streptomyces sp. NBC_01497]|uniref:hypothetical protein n=1 Tax=Streptomyces sp. NBC_01497 TaxID=2903885 RepID=UPI002E3153ED|nr:hypothetical protein [Streptomyces sp. NBC_01497]